MKRVFSGVIAFASIMALSIGSAVGSLFIAMPASAATDVLGATQSVAVGSNPRALAYSPDGNELFVANRDSNTVSVVDLTTHLAVATIALTVVAPDSVAFSPDGAHAFVGSETSDKVSVIDASSLLEVGTIDTLGGVDLLVSHDGLTLYVVEYANNSIARFSVSGATATFVSRFSDPTLATPLGIVESRGIGWLYAPFVYGGIVTGLAYFEQSTFAFQGAGGTGPMPTGISTNTWGDKFAISHGGGYQLDVYNFLEGGWRWIDVPGSSYGSALSPDGTHVFATDFVNNTYIEADLTDYANLPVPAVPATTRSFATANSGPYAMDARPDGCEIAATNANSNQVTFIAVSPCLPAPAESPFPPIDNGGDGNGDGNGLGDVTADATPTLPNTGLENGVLATVAIGGILLATVGVALVIWRRRRA